MNDPKPLLKSKTFWFNILSGLGTVLGLAGGIVAAPAMPYIAAASALVNIGLRVVTDQPVSIGGK